MKISPAEIFAASLGKSYSDLLLLRKAIADLDLRPHPPFDFLKEVWIHCVDVHKRVTLDLIKEHCGEYVERVDPYLKLIQYYETEVDLQYVLEHVLHFKTAQLVSTLHEELKNSNGDLRGRLQRWATKIARLALATEARVESCSAEALIRTTDRYKGVKLPLALGFDHCIDGGLRTGEILIFLGPPGGGKTTLLLHACLQSCRHKIPALYVSLEVSLEVVREKLQHFKRQNPLVDLSMLNIVKLPTKSVTLEEVMMLVEEYRPTVLAIDYLDLLKWNSNNDKSWLTLEELTAQFRGMCEERGLIGLTGSQANRGTDTHRRLIRLSDAAYSYGKIYTTDFCVTITPPNPLYANSTHSILYLEKNRRGPQWLQAVNIDYSAAIVTPVDIAITELEERNVRGTD